MRFSAINAVKKQLEVTVSHLNGSGNQTKKISVVKK